jgi:hypothetical protein
MPPEPGSTDRLSSVIVCARFSFGTFVVGDIILGEETLVGDDSVAGDESLRFLFDGDAFASIGDIGASTIFARLMGFPSLDQSNSVRVSGHSLMRGRCLAAAGDGDLPIARAIGALDGLEVVE